jgi:hypothetical protein
MVDEQKLSFLKNDFIELLESLKGDEKPVFGVLNPQQMIEHFGDTVRLASGKFTVSVLTPEEKLPAMKAFVMSDKEFKPGTKNPLMNEIPAPVKFTSIDLAVQKLKNAIDNFETTWRTKPETETILNPFFGNLNFEEQVQLLHKHAHHHLRQFSLIE